MIKNIKYYKTLALLATTGAITLLSGCEKKNDSDKQETQDVQEDCTHLILEFGNKEVLFKEC